MLQVPNGIGRHQQLPPLVVRAPTGSGEHRTLRASTAGLQSKGEDTLAIQSYLDRHSGNFIGQYSGRGMEAMGEGSASRKSSPEANKTTHRESHYSLLQTHSTNSCHYFLLSYYSSSPIYCGLYHAPSKAPWHKSHHYYCQALQDKLHNNPCQTPAPDTL